ncbi:MAG: hypothetical protein HOP06_08510 [Methylotenera sp.]|nr:hypothetical protein [Methylotenera sp.]
MKIVERNACLESFGKLCEEANKSNLVSDEDCQYWVYERGYLAAIDALTRVMETGLGADDFASPQLQIIAKKLAEK